MRRLTALLAAVIVATGCEGGVLGPTPVPTANATPVASISLRLHVGRTVDSLNAYWAAAYPGVSGGAAYTPLPPAQVGSYLAGEVPPLGPRCQLEPMGPNALACADHIAWEEGFLHEVTESMGAFAPQAVLAHEWGHYIQWLLGAEEIYTIRAELQADCYAGAWSRSYAAAGGATVGDIWGAIATIRYLGDDRDGRMASRYEWFDPDAHGRGSERAQAFALGFIADPAACAELSQFQRLERIQLGGGLELELMQGARAQATQQGTTVITFEGRGIPTTVETWFDRELRNLSLDALRAEGLGRFLGPNHRVIAFNESTYAGAQALQVFYEQTVQGQQGPVTLHGVLLLGLSTDGTQVFAAYESGPAPVDDAGWARVHGVLLAAQAGLAVPGGVQ